MNLTFIKMLLCWFMLSSFSWCVHLQAQHDVRAVRTPPVRLADWQPVCWSRLPSFWGWPSKIALRSFHGASMVVTDPWWPVMTRGDTPPPTVEVHLPASRSVHATPADHKWNSKIQQELQQWDCCSHLFAIVTFTKNNRLSSKWACSSHCLQPAFGLDCLDTYLKEPRLQKKVLCISMHFYAHVTAVRQLRGEKLLILSNSLQKVDSSHQLPWRKWMTGWHWSRNIKETLCLPVNETDQDWKPMKTQGPLAKNCPSKLSKSVKFTGVLEKELLDWWQA